MTTRTLTMLLGLALALALGASAAGAAPPVFPADSAYRPLRCGGHAMTDPFADDPNALLDRDVVGTTGAPAGLRAADATYLYLRLRLDRDPAPNGTLDPYSWGMELDLDGDRTTYELLVLVDGTSGPPGTVSVFTNKTITLPDDGSDPADTPPAATASFADAARTIVAPGSTSGGDPDYFLDFAVPWSVLRPLGLDHDTPTYVWAASSTSSNSLNGDFACEDAGTGPARLDTSASDPTTGDPGNDPNGGGAGGGQRLEGGGGCAAGGGAPGAWLVLAVWALGRRRTGTRDRNSRTR